jgi:hypothetical protein
MTADTNDDAPPDLEFDPTATFELLADETRFDILASLAQAPYDEYEGTLTFSELWRRTDVDDSGRFNYHLDKLVGPFIRQTDDGYQLTHLGRISYRLTASELFVRNDRAEETSRWCPKTNGEDSDVDAAGGTSGNADTDADADADGHQLPDDCPNCGSSLVATFDGDTYVVRCRECGLLGSSGELPRSAIDHHDREDLPDVFARYMRRSLVMLNDGLCRWCTSPLETTVEPAPDDRWPLADWVVSRKCTHCGSFARTTLGEAVQFHPAVVSFYDDHGVDIAATPCWRVDLTVGAVDVDVHGEEPWRGSLRVERSGDVLTLEIDDDASVIETQRTGRSPTPDDDRLGRADDGVTPNETTTTVNADVDTDSDTGADPAGAVPQPDVEDEPSERRRERSSSD